MADEPQDALGEGTEETQETPKSKLSLKTLILIGMPLVMVQAVLAYFVVSNYIEPRLPETKPRPEEKKEKVAKTGGAEDLSSFVTFPVEDIIVNPAETGGQRYLSVSVNVYIPEEFQEVISSFEPEIRNKIIERISQKRLDELDDYKDQQILREEIKNDLNAVIKRYFSKKFKGLYIPRIVFSKYTIQ